jgi:hypothetical protein
MIVELTEAGAAQIEADCLEALEFLARNDPAMSRNAIVAAMQPKRPATRAVLEAVAADHPIAAGLEQLRST